MGDGIAVADRPYSRHYWEWADEYPELYENDATCALWYRLIRLGDMAWPSAATLPVGTRKAVLEALIAADLIRMVTKTTYKVRGMDKEREGRSQSASNAARSRWGDANRNAPRNANRNAETMPSRDEPRKDEPSAVAMRPEEQRGHLDSLRTTMEASGIPLTKAAPNGKAREPVTDIEVIDHLRAVIADETADGWKRQAARDQLRAMRVDL